MKISQARLGGAFVVDVELRSDSRGFFARTYCRNEFSELGLPTEFVQSNVSHNTHKGTLRGMHYQADPFPEGKLVRCSRGAIFDVIVDLRAGSPTRCQWQGFELSASNCRALYIPAGFAHGFVTLADQTDVLYDMTEFYHPELARGVRWNDPAFDIQWPLSDPHLSDRDAGYPDYLK